MFKRNVWNWYGSVADWFILQSNSIDKPFLKLDEAETLAIVHNSDKELEHEES